LISSLYCFWFLLCTVFYFFSILFLRRNQKQYREEIKKNSTEKKSKTV
jgi:preprotein translocase subunit YajC